MRVKSKNGRRPRFHEVGLRDGLQIEKAVAPTDVKILWAERSAAAGMDIIQLGSFVHPGKVPQMADTDALFRALGPAKSGTGRPLYSGLVLNEKGLDRGLACGVEMFCMGVSASETHSLKNTGMTVDEALKRITAMAREAVAAGKTVQVSVQSAFGCGFEGPISESRVLDIVRAYLDAGIHAVSLADTAGHAHPAQVARLFRRIHEIDPVIETAGHFHNTYGTGMANVWAAFEAGVSTFEAAFGGLGGCPFTKTAAGNVATEDMVHMFQRMGFRPDIACDGLVALAREVARFFDRELPGLVYRTGPLDISRRNEP